MSAARWPRRTRSEFIDKLVHINRVAKVVKGGRRFGFAALVVVGDQKGRAGFGHGKAREVPEAIRKATDAAKRSLTRVPLREGRTLHHDVLGRHGAGKVFLRAAPPGTGIIAGGPMRAHHVVGVDEPSDFATTSCMPSVSNTARIGPPAMMPVPGGAARRKDLARAVTAKHVVMQRAAFAQRHAGQAALGCIGRLADRFRHFARLAVAEPARPF